MSAQGAAPRAGRLEGGKDRQRNAHKLSRPRPELQWRRGLREFLKHPLTTRQLAQAPIFAHAGHSLVAELRTKGLEFYTEMISIAGFGGATARIARYTLAPTSRARAEQLLARTQ